jgi:anti-sigma factor RsiW
MNTCPRSERLVALLHDGELDNPLRREVASHIAGCVVCTRTLAALDRVQELVVQAVSEQLEESDFANFWEGVVSKIDQQAPPSWRLWLQLWRERLRPVWSPGAPVWAATTAALLVTTFLVFHPLSQEGVSPRPDPPPPVLVAANDQAEIESLSATETVFLWNEPESNATVIWVGDDYDGEGP